MIARLVIARLVIARFRKSKILGEVRNFAFLLGYRYVLLGSECCFRRDLLTIGKDRHIILLYGTGYGREGGAKNGGGGMGFI